MKEKIITKMPSDYDHDDVRWQDTKTGKITGFGFLPRDNKEIGLQRCLECDSENYALNVSSGICYKCGFNANQ